MQADSEPTLSQFASYHYLATQTDFNLGSEFDGQERYWYNLLSIKETDWKTQIDVLTIRDGK